MTQEKMKLKALIIVLLLIVSLILVNTNKSLAAESKTNRFFGLYNHSIGRPIYGASYYYNVSTNGGIDTFVPKYVEYNNSKYNSPEINSLSTQIFSLKNRIHGAEEKYQIKQYNQEFDLSKIDYSEVLNNKYLKVLPQDISNFNKMMWILNKVEDPRNDDKINSLLKAAGIEATSTKTPKQVCKTETGNNNAQMSEDEFINAIQIIEQCAIWHYANNGDTLAPTITSSKGLKVGNSSYSSSFELMKFYKSTDNPLYKLYNYLITGANNAVNNGYSYNQDLSKADLKTEDASVFSLDNFYYIGPYTYDGNTDLDSVVIKTNNGTDITFSSEIVNVNTIPLAGSNASDKINRNKGTKFYIKVANNITGSVELSVSAKYDEKEIKYYSVGANALNATDPIVTIESSEKTYTKTSNKTLETPKYDCALRIFVNKIERANGIVDEAYINRIPDISDYSFSLNGTNTLMKRQKKNALSVNKGDKLYLTVRVFNEGNVVARVAEVNAYLPSGITLTNEDWKVVETKANGYTKISSSNLALQDLAEYKDKKVDYKDIPLECIVTQNPSIQGTTLNIVSEIGKLTNEYGDSVQDRDSNPNTLTDEQINDYKSGNSEVGIGYQDDDDYEHIVMTSKYIDLSIRSYIYSVNGVVVGDGNKPEREPKINLGPLQDDNDSTTTASYNHSKKPYSVASGDVIVFNVVVYNEGLMDAYANNIVYHLPVELEFISDDKDINAKNGWTFVTSEDGTSDMRNVSTKKLDSTNSDNIIKAFDGENLSTRTLQIKLKVKESAPVSTIITTIVEIMEVRDNEGNIGSDIDNSRNVTLPTKDEDFPNYKGNADNKDDLGDSNYYYKGQEDDDDFEKIVIEEFDLALKQFISKINNVSLLTNNEYDRAPSVNTSKYRTIDETSQKKYTSFEYSFGDKVGDDKNKTPVRVCLNDIITYNIRVYNEGTKDGYCESIRVLIPDGLSFIVDYENNNKWTMYDASGNVTDDVNMCKIVATRALSKEENTVEDEHLLKAFDEGTMSNNPKYLEVKVSLKVTETEALDSSRIITSSAEISKIADKDGIRVTDIDSSENNMQPSTILEDDEDIEKIYVKYFDLQLKQWISEVTIIENGVENKKDANKNPQDKDKLVKVEINEKEINNTIIKFKYTIRVLNTGEIPGTANEISNYVPDGLIFNQADNPNWKQDGDKVKTDQLRYENIDIGEYKDISIILTWKNDNNYMHKLTNTAEISSNTNGSNTIDINSIPNNKNHSEDDIDNASMMVTSVSGMIQRYVAIITGSLMVIALGMLIILRFFLKKKK